MKILVTGGSGFIGQYVREKLLEAGYEVLIYDIRNESKEGNYIEGDVFNLDGLKSVIEKYDVIVHLVGFPDAGAAQKDPMTSFKLNIVSLQNTLECCRICGGKKIIFPSSAAVYGVTQKLPVTENHMVAPSSIYSWHKYMCEKLIEAYHDNFDTSYVILRLFNTYGKGNKGVINSFIEMAKGDKAIQVYGADQLRDFIYASDVAEAFYSSIINKKAANKIINIGSGVGIKIRNILEIMQDIFPKLVVEFKESNLVEYDSIADISLARVLLDFEPRVSSNSMTEIIKREMI